MTTFAQFGDLSDLIDEVKIHFDISVLNADLDQRKATFRIARRDLTSGRNSQLGVRTSMPSLVVQIQHPDEPVVLSCVIPAGAVQLYSRTDPPGPEDMGFAQYKAAMDLAGRLAERLREYLRDDFGEKVRLSFGTISYPNDSSFILSTGSVEKNQELRSFLLSPSAPSEQTDPEPEVVAEPEEVSG